MKRPKTQEQLPQMLESLKEDKFFGSVTIHYKHGEAYRVVAETSMVLDPKDGEYNATRNR